MAQDLWTLWRKEQKSQSVHGPPMQSRVAAANRAVLAACAMILAHMAMNKGRGNAEQNGGRKMDEGSRHGMAKVGRQGMANKAVAGKHSRQTIRPAQALQQSTSRRSGRHRPCSKTASR